ncbi:UNVERIFIED_CONTAM: protein LTV1 [Sesamum calycinum]|uniref:Protein LTV1 n=1 Tax=Sesamum calycinum TaxID=2727403 RepID=A0AAW2P770_9LAMI
MCRKSVNEGDTGNSESPQKTSEDAFDKISCVWRDVKAPTFEINRHHQRPKPNSIGEVKSTSISTVALLLLLVVAVVSGRAGKEQRIYRKTMGKKKKFIDKKKSATFQLMARDTSDPNYSSDPSGDRVFVRVDNNQYTPDSFMNDGDLPADPDSIFGDAPEDCDDENANGGVGGVFSNRGQTTALPDHIRKEILELGFPDDGYNYLTHLREIKNTGGGSAYYDNPKANFDQLPRDVKAYDATRIDVSKLTDASEDKSIYSVARQSIGVRLQKVMDPEVAAILDDSDSSKFGSDIEDLEEDFVVRANILDGPVLEKIDMKLSCTMDSRVNQLQNLESGVSGAPEDGASVSGLDSQNTRVRRPLDEQFDLRSYSTQLELHEYGADSEEEYNGYMDEYECQESLTEKLNHAFKDHPSDILHLNGEGDDNESPELTAEVIRRCREYAEKYENDDHDVEEVLVEESSDESEVWDCETIISTYSTLDNHPGKIGAPEARRKKKLAEALLGTSASPNQVITLKGKERLPVDFLPRSKRHGEEKTKDENNVNDKEN